jgi:hypothetical protein
MNLRDLLTSSNVETLAVVPGHDKVISDQLNPGPITYSESGFSLSTKNWGYTPDIFRNPLRWETPSPWLLF